MLTLTLLDFKDLVDLRDSVIYLRHFSEAKVAKGVQLELGQEEEMIYR